MSAISSTPAVRPAAPAKPAPAADTSSGSETVSLGVVVAASSVVAKAPSVEPTHKLSQEYIPRVTPVSL